MRKLAYITLREASRNTSILLAGTTDFLVYAGDIKPRMARSWHSQACTVPASSARSPLLWWSTVPREGSPSRDAHVIKLSKRKHILIQSEFRSIAGKWSQREACVLANQIREFERMVRAPVLSR